MPFQPSKGQLFSAPVALDSFRALVNFRSEGIEAHTAIEQARGTVALYNALCKEPVAYLADEVGMGKTYQALGLIALAWHLQPDARILVIAPRAAVQEKWHRDYANFVSKNLLVDDNRLRDSLLGHPVHQARLCGNLIELARQTLDDPRQLFLARLSSFSFLAHSLGVRSKDELVTAGDVTDALRGRGLFVPRLDDQKAGETLDGSHAQNVECARQMLELLPRFDLVIVDEAQKLRNKGGNIFTKVFTTLLGLRGDESSEEPSTSDMPKLLLMSATPAHRAERDIYTQLSYAHPAAMTVAERGPERRQEYMNRFFVRRLRRLAGHSKYDYRQERAVARESNSREPEAIVDELFVALVQKRLERALASREHLNTSLKVGFLETFESYEPSDLEAKRRDGDDDELGDETGAATHYDTEDEHVAPDHAVLRDLARDFYERTSQKLPPHPKQRLVDEAAFESFQADQPEKLLIFVRRLASVRELVRRICQVYDQVVLERLFRVIGHTRIEQRLELASVQAGHGHPLQSRKLAQFRAYVELVLGRGAEEADDVDITDDEDRDDADIAQSQVLETFTPQKEGATAGNLFVRRFSGHGSLAGVFEENFVRLAFSLMARDGAASEDSYEDFLDRHIDGRVYAAINLHLAEDRHEADEGRTPYFYRRRGDYYSLHESRLRGLVHELALLRLQDTFDHPVVDQLLEMTRVIHERQHSLDQPGLDQNSKQAPEPSEWPESEATLRDILTATSFWDLARDCRDHDQTFIQWVRGDSYGAELSVSAVLERREALKRIIEKSFRVSEAVLDLFVAFDRAGGDSVETVSAELLELIVSDDGARTCSRIEELIDQETALRSLVESRVGSDRPLYTETRWSDFNRQEPAIGVTGGTSSRTPVMVKFNSPFFPDFLITTDVFREGVDLHMACKRVWHYGMVASPGDIEQRSGRIDRYFSKVHRGLIRRQQDGTEDDTELEIGYPYLARSVDEHQVTRVLKRKRDVQPILDKGLSYDVREELDLDHRDDETIDSLITQLNQLGDEGQYEPFPTEPHLDGGRPFEIAGFDKPATEAFRTWLIDTFERLRTDVPLVPTQHKLLVRPGTDGKLSTLLLLTNVRLSQRDGESIIVDAVDRQLDDLRQQPILAQLGFIPSIQRHFLRLSTPMGAHDAQVAVALHRRLHQRSPWTPCKVLHDPAVSTFRKHWQISLATDLIFCANTQDWPLQAHVHQRLVDLAQTADQLERRMVDITEQPQDLTYQDVPEAT